MGQVEEKPVGEQIEDAANVVADATEVPESPDTAPAETAPAETAPEPAIVIEPESAPE